MRFVRPTQLYVRIDILRIYIYTYIRRRFSTFYKIYTLPCCSPVYCLPANTVVMTCGRLHHQWRRTAIGDRGIAPYYCTLYSGLKFCGSSFKEVRTDDNDDYDDVVSLRAHFFLKSTEVARGHKTSYRKRLDGRKQTK